jgi:hypothetical protein
VNALDRIRRRSKAMARILLPLLTVAWINAAASPCVGMGSVEEDRQAQGQHHEHAVPDHDHDPQASTHEHSNCPHCPTAAVADHEGSAATHVACATAESAADSNRSNGNAFLKWDLKHTLPLSSGLVPTRTVPPGRFYRPATQDLPAPPRLPLNVRYCVFLI